MTTRRQIEASRRDAQARTGPTTEAGKAASSDGSQEELRNEPNSAQPLDPAPGSGAPAIERPRLRVRRRTRRRGQPSRSAFLTMPGLWRGGACPRDSRGKWPVL